LKRLQSNVDNQAKRLLLTNTLAPREHILDPGTLPDVFTARGLPRHHRARFAREVSLRKDVIRDVRHAFTALHLWCIEADALRRGVRTRAKHVLVMHPNSRRNIRDDEPERSRGGVSRAAGEELLNGVARLETCRGALLPPSDGAPLGVDEPLLKDVVEDVLEVEEIQGVVADADELRRLLLVCARGLLIRDPELRGAR